MLMKCVKCNALATIHVENLYACRGCFQKIIQKRVRKEIRIKDLIEKDDKILVINDGSAEGKLASHILKEIINDLPVIITVKRKKYTLGEEIIGKYNKVIIPWNADKEGEYLLNCFFEKKKPIYLSHFLKKRKAYVKLFIHVLHSEIIEYCKIKKISFSEIKKESKTTEILNSLQKEYPEIKFSLVKSAEGLKNIIQKS